MLSLSAKGLTTGEIAAHFAEVFGARVSKDTISRITEKVIGEMTEWQNRPLDRVYPVMFIDAIHVKVRDGQVTNRPVYVAIGVSVNGERDILGLWAGDGGEGAKFWLSVLTEIKNRGVEDVCITVCDGLKGLPEAINTVWELAVVQTCIVHLIRNTFRYAARQSFLGRFRIKGSACNRGFWSHGCRRDSRSRGKRSSGPDRNFRRRWMPCRSICRCCKR